MEQNIKTEKWHLIWHLDKTKKRYQIFSDIANAFKMAERERFELSHGEAA